MSQPRIANRELAPAARPEAAPSSPGQRLGAALASPVGILLVVPGLVAAVGLFLTALGQQALRDSTSQLGRDRFGEQTAFISRSIAASLAQSDPVLDRLYELASQWTSADPAPGMAHELRGLMQGRPGVAYVSVSFPDGTFRGTYRREDGAICFKEGRLHRDDTTMKSFDFGPGGALVLRSAESSGYDPRTRDFYRLAVRKGGRVWTQPYQFYGSNQTGITRAQAVWGPGSAGTGTAGPLRAVLTADFDVRALSESMAQTPLAGARTLLYTRQGALLAYPEGAAAVARVPSRPDRLIALGDLKDPVIERFSALVRGQPLAAGVFHPLSVKGEEALAMVMPVPGFPELGWTVAAIVPRNAFFSARLIHERQSLLAAAGSLLLALAVAVIFSRHLVRVRQEAAQARRLAREATDRVKELGSYRLIDRLGQGGMGEVWRAEHRLLVRQAAIKLIRSEVLAGNDWARAELSERFRREAQTLATLRSRHTIELFDYGVTEDGTFYFVMELLDGMDLLTLVERHGPQPVGRVIHLLLQACSSLAEAHRAGLVHRDVKPANVFICRAADEVDLVKVLDFGLVQAGRAQPDHPLAGAARITGERAAGPAHLSQGGFPMGTPAVMAPEQVRGAELDGRADIYSLGCLAIWLLTGHMPFEAASGLAIMAAHLTQPPPDLTRMVPGLLPAELEGILRQCLAKSRDDRPADAAALAQQLRAIELPAQEIWTAERARSWWSTHVRPSPAQRPTYAERPSGEVPEVGTGS